MQTLMKFKTLKSCFNTFHPVDSFSLLYKYITFLNKFFLIDFMNKTEFSQSLLGNVLLFFNFKSRKSKET